MELETLELINKLGNDIKSTQIYINFKAISDKVESSDEIKILSYKKDLAIMEYEDALNHYGKNSEETLKASKNMSEAIYKLNSHPLVKEYNIKLSLLNALLKEVDKELFGEIYD